jgi:hypothetical protein
MESRMVLGIIVGISIMAGSVHSDVPPLISYQGKLTDGTGVPVPDGDYTIKFCVYTDSIGDDSLWCETQWSVPLDSGLFSILLGSVNPIPDTVFTGATRWLGIQVSPDPELTPRKAIVSVGYAFHALDADTADYALSAPASSDNDWTISGDTIYHLTGNVGIGTPSPTNRLHIAGSESSPLLNIEQSGSHRGIRVHTTNACALWVANAGNHGLRITNAGGNGIHVEHADGWAGYFDGTGHFSDSVGIGTTNPQHTLHVYSASAQQAKVEGDGQAARLVLDGDSGTGADLIYQVNGNSEWGTWWSISDSGFVFAEDDDNLKTRMIIKDGGDVGIGTANPTAELEVYEAAGSNDFTIPGQIYAHAGASNAVISLKTDAAQGRLWQIISSDWDGKFRIYDGLADVDRLTIDNSGNVGIGTVSPTATLDMYGSTGYNQFRMRTSYTPTGTSDTNGNTGDMAWDDDYVYIKTSAGWKRAALSTF